MRKLPTDPTKKRKQIYKRCFLHIQHWQALIEDHGMSDVITSDEGEDIYLRDLLVGLDYLPPRQRQAFELICLRGFTETAARDVLLPNSTSSTPVQQSAESALIRMIAYYDDKQAGVWPPEPKTTRKKSRSIIMTVVHPLVRRHLEEARKNITAEIDGLKVALGQVEELLKTATAGPQSPTPQLINQVVSSTDTGQLVNAAS
jgi:hypothetical protein